MTVNEHTQIPLSHGSACATCPAAHLQRVGIDTSNADYVVALAGNPNTGKSTVFNALTGLRQHTGNWPGKTVTRMEGMFRYGDKAYKLVDLPGTYSLLATSEDEEVARDFILFGQPHVTVVVVDATRLERNLNLALQVLEITDRAVVCLNLMDEARRHGLDIDHRRLARELGVPVVPTAARQGEGIMALVATIADVAASRYARHPHRLLLKDPHLVRAVSDLASDLQKMYPGLPNARWVALRLMDNDPRMVEAVRSGELADLIAAQSGQMGGPGALELASA